MRKLLDWDDLRFFLAVARTGSLSGAARQLGVNHSTVSRRLQSLEARLDLRLFERDSDGWTATAAGDHVREAAEHMEEELAALDREILGQDARLSGTLRVATAEIGSPVITPLLAGFAARHPDIDLEVVADDALANLTRREADVALRASNAPPEHLVGRRVATLRSCVYAARDYLAGRPRTADLAEHDWVGWDDRRGETRSSQWLRRQLPRARVRVRVNSAAYLLDAVKQGMGLAHLSCFRADPDPDLVRVGDPLPDFDVGLWLLTHPDLRRTARVRAFLDDVGEHVRSVRHLMEGVAA